MRAKSRRPDLYKMIDYVRVNCSRTGNKEEFVAQLRSDGYLEIETQAVPPRQANEGHGHPYAVRGLVLAGTFTVSQNNKPTTYRLGEVFEVAAGYVHSEAVGTEGAEILVGGKY